MNGYVGRACRYLPAFTNTPPAALRREKRRLCSEPPSSTAAKLTRWHVGGPRADVALANAGYWDGFYKHHEAKKPGSTYDWYSENNAFMCEVISDRLAHTEAGETVLHLGCGTSELSRLLSAHLAPRHVEVIHGDFAPECLDLMQRRLPDLKWAQMDARALPFADASLSAIVEKGTMDALLRGGDEGWHLMLQNVIRVLRPGGRFLQVTDEAPELRLALLESFPWEVSFKELSIDAGDYDVFLYSCRRPK